MACCSFKPLFMANTKNVDRSSSKSHVVQDRNFDYKKSITLNRGVVDIYHLSCCTRISCPPPPPFSLLDVGISTLAQCMSSCSTSDNHDHDPRIKHQNSNFVTEPPLEGALVRLLSQHEFPDMEYPWLKSFEKSHSNGFIIEGRRLLTCAHCVEYETKLAISREGSTVYQATVQAISHELDLAMLTVSDDEFWEGVGVVMLGDMPSKGDEITLMGYLNTGYNIDSISSSIYDMSMVTYIQGQLKLPAFEVILNIEEGSSGSAVFNKNGRCVGMIFQGNGVVHLIPVTIIKRFIQDCDRSGGYAGLPIFAVKWQNLENHGIRMFMRMQHDQVGVLITHVEANYPELQVLKPYDVILSIDGVKISNDGTVPYVRECHIDFNYLFTLKHPGDCARVEVLRELEMYEFSIKLTTHKQFAPGNVKGRTQSYYIIGGLVFTTLTIPYLEFWDNFDDDDLLSRALHGEIIVVSSVLESDVNKGYTMDDIGNCQLFSLNGKVIEGLKELVSMVESCREEYLKFIFRNQKIVVLQTITAREKTKEILKFYGIPSALSNDLKT